MVKLFCCIVGVAGSAFSVEVNEGKTVDDLKDEIARKQKYDFAASKLQLFLAKAGGNAWLSNLTEDVKKLKNGEKTALVESLTQRDELQERIRFMSVW
ncbi:Crinkler (CRN) family protein, partial [Phytophthora infestans T30-4]